MSGRCTLKEQPSLNYLLVIVFLTRFLSGYLIAYYLMSVSLHCNHYSTKTLVIPLSNKYRVGCDSEGGCKKGRLNSKSQWSVIVGYSISGVRPIILSILHVLRLVYLISSRPLDLTLYMLPEYFLSIDGADFITFRSTSYFRSLALFFRVRITPCGVRLEWMSIVLEVWMIGWECRCVRASGRSFINRPRASIGGTKGRINATIFICPGIIGKLKGFSVL